MAASRGISQNTLRPSAAHSNDQLEAMEHILTYLTSYQGPWVLHSSPSYLKVLAHTDDLANQALISETSFLVPVSTGIATTCFFKKHYKLQYPLPCVCD
jgi:hypothetical protein